MVDEQPEIKHNEIEPWGDDDDVDDLEEENEDLLISLGQ
jgi:hypothetical protein